MYACLSGQLDITLAGGQGRFPTILSLTHAVRFLANVNSRSRSLYAIACPSVVCRLSVTLVRPTQAVQIFDNISTAFGTLAIR